MLLVIVIYTFRIILNSGEIYAKFNEFMYNGCGEYELIGLWG